MKNYNSYNKLSNGASPALPGGSGFWGFLGNIFEGIGSIDWTKFNMPTQYNSGGFFPASFPQQQQIKKSVDPVLTIVVIIAGVLIIKALKD